MKGEYRFTQLDQPTLYSGNIRISENESLVYKVTDQADMQTGSLVLVYKADLFGPCNAAEISLTRSPPT